MEYRYNPYIGYYTVKNVFNPLLSTLNTNNGYITHIYIRNIIVWLL